MILLKLLAYLGTGFDCASQNEIQSILDLGVNTDRIIYANPCKQASYISYANEMHVDQMTFDNDFELFKIKKHYPQAKCVLRIITNDSNAVCKFSMKFGADMPTSYKLIELALELKLNLIGISFHVGSGQMSPEAFTDAIDNARILFDYAKQLGCHMHLLDIGGGFPGSQSQSNLFDTICHEINDSLEKNFPAGKYDNLKIIAEPGRYYACSAFTLCCNIIAKRATKLSTEHEQIAAKENYLICHKKHANYFINEMNSTDLNILDESKSFMYYINDGVYASFNCLFYDHAECFPFIVEAKKNEKNEENRIYKTSIWGPTCDGLDLVVQECYLPEMNAGEYLIFKDMGAYTISGAVAFNGLPLAKCIYSVSSSHWNVVRLALHEFLANNSSNNLTNETINKNSNSGNSGISMAFPNIYTQKYENGKKF
jgi:ornithine decarboxylase